MAASRWSWRMVIAGVTAGAVWCGGMTLQAADDATATAGAEESTLTALEAAIVAEAEATVKAFNGGAADAMVKLFAPEAELVDEDGNVFVGHEQIGGLFRAFFERFPKAELQMEVLAARPLGDDLAIEEGVRLITADEGATAAQMRYVAVREKQGDAWPIVSYREFADDPLPSPQEMLNSLAWIVGDWVDESPEGNTTIRYRWSPDGNFLIGEYDLSVSGEAMATSSQRIGWDPVEGRLRSWTFDSDGGFSEGEWVATDDGWLVKSEAVLPDGTTGSATVTITATDADHFTVTSSDRIIGGMEEPDFTLVVARRPPPPGDEQPQAEPGAEQADGKDAKDGKDD